MSEAILRTKLTGDSAELQRTLREATASAKEFADKFKNSIRETITEVAALTIGVTTVGEALRKTYEGVRGIFDLSRDLRNLSNQTGASVHDLVQLRAEFDLSGLAADNVGGILNRMQRSIEQASDKGGPLADMFYRIGLNIYDLQQMNPSQQFDVLRQRLTAIEDPARRAEIAMKIFGNFGGGGSVLSIFGNAGIIEEANKALKEQADILAQNADTFQAVAMAQEASRINLTGFFVGLADPLSRVILPILNEFNSLDLSKWGENIGNGMADAVRVLFNAFKKGQFGTVLDEAFQGTINSFGASFKDILIGVADSFIGEMMKLIQPFSDAMRASFDQNLRLLFYGINKVAVDLGLKKNTDLTGQEMIDAGPQSVEAIVNKRIQDRKNQELRALGLDNIDPDKGLTTNQQRQMAAINANNYDPGSGIGGASSDMFQQVGAIFLKKGASEFGKPFEDMMTKLVGQFGGKIPGEGMPNSPDKGKKGPILAEDMGMGRGENITGSAWGTAGGHGVYDWAAGPVNIETGMAGRAGRVTSGPQSVEENTSQMSQTLQQIHSEIKGISAPS